MAITEAENQAQLRALITSLPIYCASTTFTLSGQAYSAAQLGTLLTSLLNASTAKAAAKAAATEAIQSEAKLVAQNAEIVSELRTTLSIMFGHAASTLAAFAVSPRKPPTPLSGAALAAANVKRQATRKARGITGKDEKAQVSGNVSGVTITPVITPAPAVASASPVATATVPIAPSPLGAVVSGPTSVIVK